MFGLVELVTIQLANSPLDSQLPFNYVDRNFGPIWYGVRCVRCVHFKSNRSGLGVFMGRVRKVEAYLGPAQL